MLVSKIEKGWLLHADGLGWLLERRGPHQQKPFALKNIFLEHRILLVRATHLRGVKSNRIQVAKSIISRQHTFLHLPAWKTVPWEDHPSSKSAIDQLVDIGTDIAEYLSILQKYVTSDFDYGCGYSRLLVQVAESLGEINAWWLKWEVNNTHAATEVTPHRELGDTPFTSLLEYDRPFTAFAVCYYNAMRILLLQLWEMLSSPPKSMRTAERNAVLDIPNPTVLLGISSDIKGLACEILQSLPYSYEMSRRFVFTCSFLFIQDVAYGCFAQHSAEATWVARHGWAAIANADNIEDANLLRRLPPLGQIKVGWRSIDSGRPNYPTSVSSTSHFRRRRVLGMQTVVDKDTHAITY